MSVSGSLAKESYSLLEKGLISVVYLVSNMKATQSKQTEKEREKDCEGEDIVSTKETLLTTWRQFCEKTTAHGWARVVGARTYLVKILWLLFTVCALVMCLIHIGRLISQFLSFSSEIKWEIQMSEIAFPSVTVCNIIPMSFSTAQRLVQNESSGFYHWYNVTKHLDAFEPMAAKLNRTDEFERTKNRLTQPMGYFENIGTEEAKLVGHQAVDFLLGCTFGIEKCYLHNFTYFQSATYYNCYTFNGGNTSRENLVSRTTGPGSGLSLILYTETDNGDKLYNGSYHTLSNVGNAAGARVVVHPADTRPSPVDRGIDIPIGYSASVGMEVLKHTRLDEPYGHCEEETMVGTDKYLYSMDSCLSLCQQRYVMEKCNCITSTLPLPQERLNLNYCAYWNVTTTEDMFYFFSNVTCEAERLMEFATSEAMRTACGCDPPCDELVYKSDVSYSYWPHDFSQEDFYNHFVLKRTDSDDLKAKTNFGNMTTYDMITSGLIRKNFIRLNVYLKELSMEEYSERKAYEFSNLFSDIGGTFGLWIGMSIITWMEVVELFGNLIHRGVKSFREERKRKKKAASKYTHDHKVAPEPEDQSKKQQEM